MTYELVEDDAEFDRVADLFAQKAEDYTVETDDWLTNVLGWFFAVCKGPFLYKNERKKKQQNTEGKTAALIGLEKRSGNVFVIVEYRLLFFCLPFFGKGTLILPFKENFFAPYYKENDRENKKGGVFFGREKIREGEDVYKRQVP